MQPPSIRLVLDDPGAIFACGSPISGRVDVTVGEACEGWTLLAVIAYEGHGDAPQQDFNCARDAETVRLFEGNWPPGTHSYRFTLPAPEACAYQGAIMNLRWSVRAGAGVRPANSAAAQASDQRPIEIVPREVSPADRERAHSSELIRREPAPVSRGCLLSSVALVGIGALATWLGAEHDAAIPGIVAIVLGVTMLGIMVRQALLNRKVASTELRIGSVVAWPGAVLPCRLTLQPKVPLEIRRATVALEGREQVKKFTGLNRTVGPTNTHRVHLKEWELLRPSGALHAGVPLELTAEVVVPADAICTMDFDHELKFLWRIEVRVEIPGSPDWFDAQPITVLPRTPESAGA